MINAMALDSITSPFTTDLEWVYEQKWSELEEWYFNRPSLAYLSDWGIQYVEKIGHHKYNKTTPHLNSNKLYFKKTKPYTRGRIMKRIKNERFRSTFK